MRFAERPYGRKNARSRRKFSLLAGYRAQGFEFDRGSGLSQFGADWTQQGLILGGIFRF